MTKEEQLQTLASEYLKAFLGFAINKTGNSGEAEELAQEITYQSILAIHKGRIIGDFNAYIWSVAHNTFKRWCQRKRPLSLDGEPDTFSNIISDDMPIADQLAGNEEVNAVRIALSRLASDYRKVLVCFYYEELSIRETGQRLSLSEGMVKFYLRAGKQKLKEAFELDSIGEKSFHPSEFSVYKSGIDFSKVNVWEVFKRKLPCQIALVCHDSPKTISDISIETGTPAVYIEDEIHFLMDAGVMICPVKDKYRTNFHILKKNAAEQVKEQFHRLNEAYMPYILSAYEQYLPKLKECEVFRFDATVNQWAWFFAMHISDFDYCGHGLSVDDYPQILSCGSKSFIFAEESKGSVWGVGRTPTFLDDCTVYPCDVVAFGPYHCQEELWDKRKAQALYDIYRGAVKQSDTDLYAELVEQGYAVKQDGKLFCNIAVSTAKSTKLFEEINAGLTEKLHSLCGEIRENISRIVKTTIPEQLRPYAKGYSETWISFYAGVYLREALYNSGFIAIPENDSPVPVACEIDEKQ